MKYSFLLILSLAIHDAKADESVNLDAHNKGEAIGMMYSLISKINVYHFMCNRYHPDLTESFLNSLEAWAERRKVVLSQYSIGLESTSPEDLEELYSYDKKIYRNRIILFNRLNPEEQKSLCKNEITKLNENIREREVPNMFKLLREK